MSLLIGAMSFCADTMDVMKCVFECPGELEITVEPSEEELLKSVEAQEDELGLHDWNDLSLMAVTFEDGEAALQMAMTYFEQRGALCNSPHSVLSQGDH